MQDSMQDKSIKQALTDEENQADVPKHHTSQVMQGINMAKVFKDLLNLEITTPTEVVKTFKKEK